MIVRFATGNPVTVAARFASNVLILLAGAVVVVGRFAFSPTVVRWLTVGVGCSVVVVTAVFFLTRGRGPAQRLLDGLEAVLGAWTIVSTLTVAFSTVRWLALAEGCALAAAGVLGLVLHEILMESALRRPLAAGQGTAAVADGYSTAPVAAPAPPISVARRSL